MWIENSIQKKMKSYYRNADTKKSGIRNGLDAKFRPRLGFPHVDNLDVVFPHMVFVAQLNTNISNTNESSIKSVCPSE